MDSILSEIERAIEARLFYLAIMLCLSLPDICAALESDDGRSTMQRYKTWYAANMASRFPSLSPDDFYSLRCGVIHQGKFGFAGAQFDRAIFALPGRFVLKNCVVNNAWVFSALDFCQEAIFSVRAWALAKRHDPIVQANLPRLVEVRPEGLSPYIVGQAVIG